MGLDTDALELARTTPLSYERACLAIQLWTVIGYARNDAREMICRCLIGGYDPIEMAYRVAAVKDAGSIPEMNG